MRQNAACKKCAEMSLIVFIHLGKIEDLDAINAEQLYEQYRAVAAKAPIDIYVVGNTTLS